MLMYSFQIVFSAIPTEQILQMSILLEICLLVCQLHWLSSGLKVFLLKMALSFMAELRWR